MILINRTARVLLLLVLGAILCSCSEVGNEPEQSPVLHYFKIQEQAVPVVSRLPGRVTAIMVSEVRPQVDGIIQEKLFTEGAMVAKGQILYQIDPAPYLAARNMAKAELAAAEARAAELELQEKRNQGLARSMAVSQQNLEGVVSAYAQARAKVMRVRAELERAEIDLAYTTIKAPISGRISASRITPGALVTASQESQLATILQTDQVYVDMMQSGLEYLRIKRERSKNRQACDRGKTLVRLVPQDGPVFSLPQKPDGMEWPEATGELLLSEDTVSPGTGCVLRRAIFPNPDGLLLPGMTVTAIVEEDTLKNALLVPQRAVMSDSGGRHHVFVLHEKNSQEQSFAVGRKDIELGTPVGHCWLVRAGLAAGDLVLVEGMQKTGPGETVRATRVLE